MASEERELAKNAKGFIEDFMKEGFTREEAFELLKVSVKQVAEAGVMAEQSMMESMMSDLEDKHRMM